MASTHSRRITAALAATAVLACLGASVLAQSPTRNADCESAPPSKPATSTDKSADSGTKNMGSTGWSGGGMGGSHNDTTPSGPAPGSPNEQPATAKGLDPIKPDTQAPRPC